MTDRDSDDRHHKISNIRPEGWDMGPQSISTEIREFLKSIKDEGTQIDSGFGDGHADLWVKVDGVEYLVQIMRSMNQQREDLDNETGRGQ